MDERTIAATLNTLEMARIEALAVQYAWTLPLALLAYQLIIDFVPLAPFNDVRADTAWNKLVATAVNYSPLLLIAYALKTPAAMGALLSFVGSGLYLLGHLNAWWRPYLFGASAKEKAEYERLFSRTLKVLPRLGANPVPDLEHMVLGLLVVAMVVGSGAAWLAVR